MPAASDTHMVVGALRVVLAVSGSQSLKEKRQVVRSLLDTARHRFGVSAAEIGRLDSVRTAELAFACVSNDPSVVHGVLSRVAGAIEGNPLCEVLESSTELL